MVLPAAAGPVQVEAIESVATVGGGSFRIDASAGRIRGAPATAAACSGRCSGTPAPPRSPPPAVEEGTVLRGQQEKRRAPEGRATLSPSEPPLTPVLQLAVANELITRFAMAQEKRSLSDAELSLVKFLLSRIPGLEAEAAAEACGGEHSPRWGLMVRAPLRLACLLRRGIERRAASPHCTFPSSEEEPLTPAPQLEIAKEVVSRLASLIEFLEDRVPGLKAVSEVGRGVAAPVSPKMAPSYRARALAKASRAVAMAKGSPAVAVSSLPVATLHRPEQVAMPADAHVTVGRQVVTRHSGEEDSHATSGVHSNMSEANVNLEHHRGQELSSEHESFVSSLSSTEEPLTPALQLEIAKKLIRHFTTAQEKRMLSACELFLIKFLEDRIPGFEAEAALGACSGQHSVRRGFMIATPVRWAWLHRESIRRRAAPCGPSSEELLTPEIELEIASEVINHLAVAQERRILSGIELCLVKFLGDRIPDLEAAASRMRGGATPSPYEVAPSHSRARAKIRCHAAAVSSLMVSTLTDEDSTPAAHFTTGQQVATRHSGEEGASANSIVVDGSSSSPSSSKEPPTPEIQLEIAKEVISQLVMQQEKRMLSADEHALIKFLEDRIPELEAAIGVRSGETQSLSKVASSCIARAKARSVIFATLSSVEDNLHRPGLCTPMVHPMSHQDAIPTTHLTVDQEVIIRHSFEEDAHATSAVHKMSDANFSHEHHRGQELSSKHESFVSSLSSSTEEPLTPALQLEIAKELIRRFTAAQEKRMLSAGELSLIKFLEDRIPGLEAVSALGACSGQHSVRRGFMVATPMRWSWLHRERIRRRAAPCGPSSEELLTPEIELEIASEVINHLAVAQERRILSGIELCLVKFLGDRIPDLEVAASGMCGGATPSPSEVAPSHSRARAKIRCHAAAVSSLMVSTLTDEDSTPAAHVTAGQQVATRHSGEEDAGANSIVIDGSSSSPSSSSKEPPTPEIQLEIAKEVISQLVMQQEKRMLSAGEHALIKFLEDRIPELEAATGGVRSGETRSLSKVASSCLARAKARSIIFATLSSVEDNLHRPGLCTPMVHPLSHQDAMPAAHVTVGQEVVIRHSDEEDAHGTSAVHKMSDANFMHEHHRAGQLLSTENELFLEKCDSECDLGVVTEKSNTTIAPEMAPPPSDGDSTAESSGVSTRWGMAPDAEGSNDFGLPDDLGLY